MSKSYRKKRGSRKKAKPPVVRSSSEDEMNDCNEVKEGGKNLERRSSALLPAVKMGEKQTLPSSSKLVSSNEISNGVGAPNHSGERECERAISDQELPNLSAAAQSSTSFLNIKIKEEKMDPGYGDIIPVNRTTPEQSQVKIKSEPLEKPVVNKEINTIVKDASATSSVSAEGMDTNQNECVVTSVKRNSDVLCNTEQNRKKIKTEPIGDDAQNGNQTPNNSSPCRSPVGNDVNLSHPAVPVNNKVVNTEKERSVEQLTKRIKIEPFENINQTSADIFLQCQPTGRSVNHHSTPISTGVSAGGEMNEKVSDKNRTPSDNASQYRSSAQNGAAGVPFQTPAQYVGCNISNASSEKRSLRKYLDLSASLISTDFIEIFQYAKQFGTSGDSFGSVFFKRNAGVVKDDGQTSIRSCKEDTEINIVDNSSDPVEQQTLSGKCIPNMRPQPTRSEGNRVSETPTASKHSNIDSSASEIASEKRKSAVTSENSPGIQIDYEMLKISLANLGTLNTQNSNLFSQPVISERSKLPVHSDSVPKASTSNASSTVNLRIRSNMIKPLDMPSVVNRFSRDSRAALNSVQNSGAISRQIGQNSLFSTAHSADKNNGSYNSKRFPDPENSLCPSTPNAAMNVKRKATGVQQVPVAFPSKNNNSSPSDPRLRKFPTSFVTNRQSHFASTSSATASTSQPLPLHSSLNTPFITAIHNNLYQTPRHPHQTSASISTPNVATQVMKPGTTPISIPKQSFPSATLHSSPSRNYTNPQLYSSSESSHSKYPSLVPSSDQRRVLQTTNSSGFLSKEEKQQTIEKSVGRKVVKRNIPFMITEWKIDWLETQSQKTVPPPIYKESSTNSQNTNRIDPYFEVKDNYESFEEYYNTYFPLHLLNVWHNLYGEWKECVNFTERHFTCTVDLVSGDKTRVKSEVKDIYFDDFPKRDGIILINYFYKEETKRIFGIVTDVLAKPHSIGLKKLLCTFCTATKIESKAIDIFPVINIRTFIKQAEALYAFRNSEMRHVILNPAKYTSKIKAIDFHTERSKYAECIAEIRKHVLFPDTDIVLLKRPSGISSMEFTARAVKGMVATLTQPKTVIMICVKTVPKFKALARMLIHCNLVLAVKPTEVDVDSDLLMYTIREKANLEPNSSGAIPRVLMKCQVILTVLSKIYLDEVGAVFSDLNLVCMIDDAAQCTETETLLPVALYNAKTLILMADLEENVVLPKNNLTPFLVKKGLNRSLFSRLLKRHL